MTELPGLTIQLFLLSFILFKGALTADDTYTYLPLANTDANAHLSTLEYEELCACMEEYKQKVAEKYGISIKAAPKTNTTTKCNIVGDVIFSKADCQRKLKNLKLTSRRTKRTYNDDPYHPNKWGNPIKYSYDGSLTVDDRNMIEAALHDFRENTCLVFEETDTIFKDVMKFGNLDVKHCYSYWGRQEEMDIQFVNVPTKECTGNIGLVIHHIAHTLGLLHEQNRMDRDQYVQLNHNVMHPEFIIIMDLYSWSNPYKIPYDHGSIMALDAHAYSRAGEMVFETLDRRFQYTMGQRGQLSFFDTQLLNSVYCEKSCANVTVPMCEFGGYQDPNACDKCKCPEGFGGNLCEKTARSDRECKPAGELLDKNGCLQSPGYDDPKTYPIGSKCNWIIRAPSGMRVNVTFDDDFGLYCAGDTKTGPSCEHYVEIKDNEHAHQRGFRVCCYQKGALKWNNPRSYISKTSRLIVHFDATWPKFKNAYTVPPSPAQLRGFKMCYNMVPAPKRNDPPYMSTSASSKLLITYPLALVVLVAAFFTL